MDKRKIKYLRIALGIQGLGMEEKNLHKMINTYEAIINKGGELNIKDIVEIEIAVDKIYSEKQFLFEKKR